MNDIFKYNRSDSEDYYKLLGCSVHSTEEQIQKEYKIRALELHPDKCHSTENYKKEIRNEQFQKLKKAKEVLLDKEKRMLYDKWLLGGITMSFDQFQNYTKNNCQSFHWAFKKSDMMLTNDNSTSQKTINQENESNLERKSRILNLKDTPVFRTNDFMWRENDSSDLLRKFRNYEI